MLLKVPSNRQSWKEEEDPSISGHLSLLQRSKSAMDRKLKNLKKKKKHIESDIIPNTKRNLNKSSLKKSQSAIYQSLNSLQMRRVKTDANDNRDDMKVLIRELTGIDEWVHDKIHRKLYLCSRLIGLIRREVLGWRDELG